MRQTQSVLVVFLALLVLAPHASAVPQGKTATPQLVITSAVADLDRQELVVGGLNFGDAPLVVLDGIVLPVYAVASSSLVAGLPASVAAHPGTYLLIVSRGPSQTKVGSYDVTV